MFCIFLDCSHVVRLYQKSVCKVYRTCLQSSVAGLIMPDQRHYFPFIPIPWEQSINLYWDIAYHLYFSLKPLTFPGNMQVATKYLDPIGSVVWTFKETDGQTDKQSIYIDQLPLEKRFPYFFRLQIIFQKLNIKYSKIFIFLSTCKQIF